MSCLLSDRNGNPSPKLTSISNYIEDTPSSFKSSEEFKKLLVKNNLISRKGDNLIVNEPFENINPIDIIADFDTLYPGILKVVTKYPSYATNNLKDKSKISLLKIDNGALESYPNAEEIKKTNLERIAKSGLKDFFTKEDVAKISGLSNLDVKKSQSSEGFGKVKTNLTPEEQIVKLQNAFSSIGVDVTVNIDSSIEEAGKIESVESKPVITINPEKLGGDTVYHEFGHLYIDMLGYENAAVQSALEALKGTDLHNKVKAMYPELGDVELEKELLATAIGIEGAKINRSSPSKIQVLLNKLFRAFSNMLNSVGIKSTPTTAADLALELFAGQMREDEMINSLSDAVQYSKTSTEEDSSEKDSKEKSKKKAASKLTKTQKLVQKLQVQVENELTMVRKMPENSKAAIKARNEALDKALAQKTALSDIKKVKELLKFVEYTKSHVDELKTKFEKIKKDSEKEKNRPSSRKMLKDGYEIKRYIDALETIKPLKFIVDDESKKRNNKLDSKNLSTMEKDLQAIFKTADRIENDYKMFIIPLMADSLMHHTNKNVDEKLKEILESVKKNRRWTGYLDKKDRRYIELKKQFDDEKITAEEFDEGRLAITKSQIKNKIIGGRASLIRQLESAYKDKSAFSMYMDPLIYSNDRAVQIFQKLVDSANLNKNNKLLKLKTGLNSKIQQLAQGRSANNMEDLYGNFIEEIDIPMYVDGKEESVDVLAIVQPIDVKKYKESERDMYRKLAAKYDKPMRKNYKDDESFKEDIDKWKKEGKVNAYTIERDNWYKSNTEPIEGWRKKLKELNKEIAAQKKIVAASKGDENRSDYSKAKYKLESLRRYKNNNVTKTGLPRGEFVKPDSSKYSNSKYAAIQSNQQLKEFYDYFVETYASLNKKIGKALYTNSWDETSYVLPFARKSFIDKIQEEGAVKATKDMVKDSFTLQSTDTEYGEYNSLSGELDKKIPIFYTSYVDKDLVSKDIGSSLYLFADMAYNFEEKSKILGEVMAMRDIMENRQALEVTASGVTIMNKKAKNLGFDLQQTKGGVSNTLQAIDNFIDANVFGQKEIKATLGKLDLNKAASNLNSFTALRNLSFNLLQVTNQTILDNMMMGQEAIASEFMTSKNLAWAQAKYFTEGAGLPDIGKFMPETKLGKAMEFFDALTEVTDREGKRITIGAGRKFLDLGNLMHAQAAAEHQASGVRMLAILNNIKAKDKEGNPILNESGQEADMWDMLKTREDGSMYIDERVDNTSQEDIIRLLRGIGRRINQTKGSIDKAAAERNWAMKMLMLFRHYFTPGFRRRFGHGEKLHVDEELGTVTQGMYMSFANMIVEAYEKKTFNIGAVYESMSSVEQANIKRTATELASILGAGVLLLALAALADDDEDSYMLNFTMYQVKRFQSELLQWNPVVGTPDLIRIAKSPSATVKPLEDGIKLMKQVFLYSIPSAVGMPVDEKHITFQRSTGMYDKGESKLKKEIYQFIPVVRGIEKAATPEEALKWFNL